MVKARNLMKGGTGFGMVKFILEKLQYGLPLLKVREGQFVVIATQCGKPERFVVELAYLRSPEFLKLLKQAEEEFGFSQKGALAIPCRPDELQRILS